ncbi:putative leucine-rich repeat domain, L domain-containing protein [Rosa chinensis]|uniref:Putative leucine-rich repeat domain, L domain-containing protein n=1 Tax=Rosa chinensis TaxID=74649 RepID=A0A2P6PH43_ROSCH|nr:uncharacterized protein LOC112180753 [Rosa chinensis]PRQ21218.1 putative leucine-rich repeat domain, L domain-containing protein [Rosa chinensis]
MDYMFYKREDLKLNELPNITRFCSGSIEKLDTEGWIKLGEYNAAMNRNTNEIEKTHSEENLDITSELINIQYFLFDLKDVFPKLTTLTVHERDRLSFLFTISMAKSLVELKHLEISTCEIIEEIVSSTSEYCQENMENMFPKLEELKLNKLPNLTRFCSGSYIQLLSLEKLDIQGCTKLGAFISDNIAMSGKNTRIYKEIEEKDSEGNNTLNTVQYFLYDEKMGLPNLKSLVVHRCDGLRFLSSMARSLVQLKHLEISEFQIMEVVLTEVYSEENKDNMFPKLEQLKLNDLPFLDRFCSGSYVEFASLEGLHLEQCTKLETFICNPLSNSIASSKEVEERNRDQNIETVVPCLLFDKKVGFPKLERLTIIGLPKLKTIWHTQLAPDSFCGLRDVTVQHCNSLKYIFPGSLIADVFNQRLQNLTVEECGVEEIISQGGGLEDQFVFPNLISLEFKSLFQLKRFYPRMLAFSWPLLKTLVLLDCPKVDIFAAEFAGLQKTHDLRSLDTPAAKLLTPTKQSSILINENSFPKLEDLTLVPMDIWYGRPISAVCCEKAVFAGISNRHRDGSLPHLRTLRLHGMDMRLWKKTKPAGQNSPRLEILEVKFCRLNNLELSSLSFQNLTILEVTFCWRLQYLTTYSVARGLRQLKKLKVDECKSMKQILASEGIGEDDSNCEIVFSKLQHLELSDLTSLERFCSRNCTVKVPTLETVEVNWCSIKLKVSSSGILVVDSNMHLDVQKSHSSKEAFNTTESTCSSEKTQKQPVTNSSEEAEHIEFNARELHDDSLIERLKEEFRASKADIRRLEEELRAEKAERRDHSALL